MAPPNPLFLPYVYAPNVMAMGIAMPVVCIFVVGTRFVIRKRQKGGIGIDDWLALASLFMIIGMGTCFIAGVKLHALGYVTPSPPSNLTAADELNYLHPSTKILDQIEFSFQHLMLCEYALVKLSILFFYRRLFVVGNTGSFHIASIITIVTIVLWFIAMTALFLFDCGRYIDASWGSNLFIEKGCHGGIAYTVENQEAMAISDFVLDLVIFLFPFPAIWKLHLPNKRKLAITSIFTVGFMAIAASIIRLAYYEQGLSKSIETEQLELDENLAFTLALWWSFLEAGLALIAACLPSLSYLLSKRSMKLDSLVMSVRNKLSLRSLRSQAAGVERAGSTLEKSGKLRKYKQFDDNGSFTSRVEMVPSGGI